MEIPAQTGNGGRGEGSTIPSFSAGKMSLVRSLAIGATLLLPFTLLYTRAIGDGLLTVIGVLFLISHWTSRDWTWLRTPWTRLALLFWAWVVLCTLVSDYGNVSKGPPISQAILSLRFFLFVAALENWVLTDLRTCRWLWYVTVTVAVWILVESWQQYILGFNIFGYPRFGDGALTGPLPGPRAGATLLMVFFPAFLPLCLRLLKRAGRMDLIYGIVVPVVAAATMILIGQRMPTLLLALGLCLSGLMFRQFRLPVVLTLAICVAVVAVLPVVSPPTFAKLVVHFTQQMEHFWDTPYGLIFDRAVTMVQLHPWIGLGWDGYRDNCMQPAYLGGVSWLPVRNPADAFGCNLHPHNYWLQVATTAGLPGVVLFAAMIGAWLQRMRGGAAYLANDRRAALLIIVFVTFWPIQSSTSLFTVPNAGWVFLMVGWGLAEAGLVDPVSTFAGKQVQGGSRV